MQYVREWRVHTWYGVDRHEQWKRVAYEAIFFFVEVKHRGLVLAPKMCPSQPQAFKEVNNSQAFAYDRKKKKKSLIFSGRAAYRCSKACLHKVSRKHSKS